MLDQLTQRLWPLNPAALRAHAERRTGLRDYGEPSLEPALGALTQSLHREANLHPLGRFLAWNHLTDFLVTRLRLVDAWKRAPASTLPPVSRPLFVTGLPRTGSTFLHELLAADPQNRAPRVWETMFPLPAPGDAGGSPDTRVRRAAARLWWFRRLARGADAVHPLRAESPQECEAIHSYTLQSEEFLSTFWLPSYESWLRSADFIPVYAWQKRFLQHLASGAPDSRWVLKSPDHAHSLSALFAVFPDAVIVQTHREPADVFASSLQLVEVLHRLFARTAGSAERAAREARVLADAIDRLLKFREAHPELKERFIDIKYSDLVSSPLAAVERIYAGWGMPLTPEATAAMRRLIAQRSRYPKRRFLSRLTPEATDRQTDLRRFDRYRAQFGFPVPP